MVLKLKLVRYTIPFFILFIHTICWSSDNEVMITVQRLSNRAINLRVGDVAPFGDIICNNVVALASLKGLIIIDTGYYPQSATKLRKIVVREFGRDDFAYVINTHWHWDHINGNQAFSDIPIIGHENIIPALEQFEQGLESFIQQREDRIRAWKERMLQAKPGSEDERTARGWIFAHQQFIEEYKQGYTLTYPTFTFRDRLTLDMDDMTLHLIHVPAYHTDNDILVYIPEQKILVIGDLFYNVYLPRIKHSAVQSILELLAILTPIISSGKPVETVIPGHNTLMSGTDLRKQIEYIKTLWEDVHKLKNSGNCLEDMKNQLSLKKKFNYLKDFPFYDNSQSVHEKNIENIRHSDKASAVLKLQQLISTKDLGEALELFRQLYFDNEDYFYSEEEFIDYGYDCLMFNRIKEAVSVFSLYAEINPQSWNTWDSLGEAWMKAGDNEQAEACYSKSLELNPENSNARSMLEKLLKN